MLDKINLSLSKDEDLGVYDVILSLEDRSIDFDYKYEGKNSEPTKEEILIEFLQNHGSVALVDDYADWLYEYDLKDSGYNRDLYNNYIENSEKIEFLLGVYFGEICEELGV